jgi:hypothetical protein
MSLHLDRENKNATANVFATIYGGVEDVYRLLWNYYCYPSKHYFEMPPIAMKFIYTRDGTINPDSDAGDQVKIRLHYYYFKQRYVVFWHPIGNLFDNDIVKGWLEKKFASAVHTNQDNMHNIDDQEEVNRRVYIDMIEDIEDKDVGGTVSCGSSDSIQLIRNFFLGEHAKFMEYDIQSKNIGEIWELRNQKGKYTCIHLREHSVAGRTFITWYIASSFADIPSAHDFIHKKFPNGLHLAPSEFHKVLAEPNQKVKKRKCDDEALH